jgi:DNA-binding NarL/FixJ family response regulator
MIRILVVDDQKNIQQVLKIYLEKEPDIEIVGYAFNGQEAIEKVEQLKPDIVLMDLEMPVMDGLTATKLITASSMDTKVLILSFHDSERHLKEALKLGAKGYLLKTTTSEELISIIRYAYKGYFQLGPDLVEKYLHKFTKLQSDLDEMYQLKQKLDEQSKIIENLVQSSRFNSKIQEENQFKILDALDSKLANLKIEIDKKISKQIEKIGVSNKSLPSEYVNMGLEIDEIKYALDKNLVKLEKKVSWLSKLQLSHIVILSILVLITCYFLILKGL